MRRRLWGFAFSVSLFTACNSIVGNESHYYFDAPMHGGQGVAVAGASSSASRGGSGANAGDNGGGTSGAQSLGGAPDAGATGTSQPGAGELGGADAAGTSAITTGGVRGDGGTNNVPAQGGMAEMGPAGAGSASGGSSSLGGTAGQSGDGGNNNPSGGTTGAGGATGTGGATGIGGSPGSGGSSPGCALTDPGLLFEDGFESYTVGTIDSDASSPWQRIRASNSDGWVSIQLPHSCSQSLAEYGSTAATRELDFLSLALDSRPAKLNLELWYTPVDSSGTSSYAEFGLGQLETGSSNLNPAYRFYGVGRNLLFASASSSSTKVFGNLSRSSSISNYIRAEFDLCAKQVTVFVGTDPASVQSTTVPLDNDLPFNGLYIQAGGSITYFDDVAIWTPSRTVDYLKMCPLKLLGQISSPGSQCNGIAQGTGSLWMMDNLDSIYELDYSGNVLSSFKSSVHGWGLVWDGQALWTLTNENLSKLDPDGSVADVRDFTFGDYGSSSWTWDGKNYWSMDLVNAVHKYDVSGNELYNWGTHLFNPTGIAVTHGSVWIGDLYDGTLLSYDLQGNQLRSLPASSIGIPSTGFPSAECYLAPDLATGLWYCASDFTIYHINVSH